MAEEAFLEALAHDSGSARGALGMQVICERLHRDEETPRFRRATCCCWRHAADPGLLQVELHYRAPRSGRDDWSGDPGGSKGVGQLALGGKMATAIRNVADLACGGFRRRATRTASDSLHHRGPGDRRRHYQHS